jgi:hypothetical protein
MIIFGGGSGIARLYVVKGGPGTGKSHFMREVARYAQARGYDPTYYYCSSDPASLDGVRLERAGKSCIGLIDGTAPHVWEPSLPGVKEEMVNLGSFWDAEALCRESEAVTRLTEAKADCYGRAYRYLAACGQTAGIADGLIAPCVLEKKLTALASRLVREQKGEGGSSTVTPAHIRAVGMTGRAYFDTYIRMAQAGGGEVICVQDYYGVGYLLMSEIFSMASRRGCRMLVSRDPVHPHRIDGIFFKDTALCITVAEPHECPETCRFISLRRYVDPTRLKEKRAILRHAVSQTESLTDGALHSLAEAGKHHFALERLYAATMDFPAKEAYTASFCRRLLGE